MEIPHHKTAARDFFLYLLAIITLYISVWRFIDLLFEYINKLFPDQLEKWHLVSFEDIRFSLAAMIVVFPVYIGVTWFLRKDVIAHPEKRELRVRKWLLNLTLFVAAITIIVDLITLVNAFLNGELTLRFVLKVLVVLIVAGAVLAYYLWDLKRETLPTSRPSKLIASIASGVVTVSIIAGFFIIESPWERRQARFDELRVNDLQQIDNEIIHFWQSKGKLPTSLQEVNAAIAEISKMKPPHTLPQDPVTKSDYEYRATGTVSFELCATFRFPSQNRDRGEYLPPPSIVRGPWESGNYWNHDGGRVCFLRVIDTAAYGVTKEQRGY